MLTLRRLANRATKERTLLRGMAISVYVTATRLAVRRPPPRVLLNGPGKSGTHLLADGLSLLPRMGFSGRHFTLEGFAGGATQTPDFYPPNEPGAASIDVDRLRRYLRACPNGMFASAHAPWHPALASIVHELEYKQLLMLRDPRDLIMSYVHFALRERLHHHHEYFTTSLTTMTDRITALIEGIDRDACPTSPRPPLRNIFEGYLRWIDDERVLACRYEDLVGARGGGDADAQLENVMAIAEFLERPLTEEQAHGIAKKMYNPRSLTFRAGRVGGWQEHFTAEVWRVFDADFGDMMERLGYRR